MNLDAMAQRAAIAFARWRYAGRADAALRRLWQASPLCGKRGREFLAVDLETTGLRPADDEVLSIAWVPVRAGAAYPGEGRHLLVKPRQSVGDSAAFHALRDCDLVGAINLEAALAAFFEVAAGRVLVFHGGQLDLALLNAGCRRQFGAPLLMPHIDTLVWQRRRLNRRQQPIAPGELRLGACRRAFHLPDYPPHNAAVDALATAELLLALLASQA